MIEIRFREDLSFCQQGDSTAILARPHHRLRLTNLAPGQLAALESLAAAGRTYDQLLQIARPNGADSQDDLRLRKLIAQLTSRCHLRFAAVVEGEVLLLARPTTALAEFTFPDRLPDAEIKLSRFSYVRSEGDTLLIESPLSHARVEVRWPQATLILSDLLTPVRAEDLVAGGAQHDRERIRACLLLLVGTGIAAPVDPDGRHPEETDPEIVVREFHDVAFHVASRSGLADRPMGAFFPFKGILAPPPPVARPEGVAVRLTRPDLEVLVSTDPPLARVMEARRSVREFDAEPPDERQLGEFLFRVMHCHSSPSSGPDLARSISHRVCPSGGGLHDIQAYVVVDRCGGLARGVYHYDPLDHLLTVVSTDDRPVRGFTLHAQMAARIESSPPLIIILACRFGVTSWKYRGLSYATSIKNAGVMIEAMYLAATAMGLGGCALGSGDSAIFGRTIGRPVHAESSVGEFMLGRPRTGRASSSTPGAD